MDCSVLTKCSLFRNIPEEELRKLLQGLECNVRTFEKGETVFRFMDRAESIGIVLEKRQEPLPCPAYSQRWELFIQGWRGGAPS